MIPTKKKGDTLLIKSQEALVDTNTETQSRCRTHCIVILQAIVYHSQAGKPSTSKAFRVRIDDQINHIVLN